MSEQEKAALRLEFLEAAEPMLNFWRTKGVDDRFGGYFCVCVGDDYEKIAAEETKGIVRTGRHFFLQTEAARCFHAFRKQPCIFRGISK